MRFLFFILLFFVSAIVPAQADNRTPLIKDCPSIEDCLEILGRTLPLEDKGIYDHDIDEIRAILKQRFGDAARDALLAKAQEDHGGWKNFAGALLGDLGTDAAIEALVEDLKNGDGNQTSGTLESLGQQALPFLLPILEMPGPEELPPGADYQDGWHAAASVIKENRSKAIPVANEWISIARDRRAMSIKRIAALRGLSAIGGFLGAESARLRPLLHDRDKAVSKQAYKTLVAAYDPTVARRLAASCKTNADQWTHLEPDLFACLRALSEFGTNAREAGDLIMHYLSGAKTDQLYAIETLGLIGYVQAIPEIEQFLQSNDWRLVLVATRALGQLHSVSSITKIEAATKDHWIFEIDLYAQQTGDALIRHRPTPEPYNQVMFPDFYGHFGDQLWVLGDWTVCDWNVWEYQGKRLTFGSADLPDGETVRLPGGDLVATDRGEFGGALTWRRADGSEDIVVPDNTSHLLHAGDDFLAVHGLSHITTSYGYVTLVSRQGDGWSAREILRLPSAANFAKSVGDGLFAVAAESGHVAVFNKDGAVQPAYCDLSARPRSFADR